MMYQEYSPAGSGSASTPYRSSYIDHPASLAQPHPHHPASAAGSISSASTALHSPNVERIEYKGNMLISTNLENHLAGNPLIRDCAVVGVPQPGGIASTSFASQPTVGGIVPITFIALSSSGRERSAKGGEKESKRMKSELLKWLIDFAPAFKQMKGKLLFVDSIPRGPGGAVIRRALIEKANSSPVPPVPGPSKGFFSTVLSEPSSGAATPAIADNLASVATSLDSSPPKKSVRDSKRRATHSQIERRRREKINDRLVTLRSIVPACAQELEDRKRQKQEEEEEAARIAAGGAPKTYIDAVTGKPKRKRNRKKPEAKKTESGGDKEEELGLHKLEVLTHAINYIFELKAHIHKLETGSEPEHIPTADNPFGVRNSDGTYRQDAKVEDDPTQAMHPSASSSGLLRNESSSDKKSRPLAQKRGPGIENDEYDREKEDQDDDDDDEEEEEEEEDEIEDDPKEDDEDEPLERHAKKRMSAADHSSKSHAHPSSSTATNSRSYAGSAARYRRGNYSSSSGRDSEEVSPAFSIIQQSPATMSPATTITSPMMSLSAESPILLPDPAISTKRGGVSRVSQSPAFPPLPASAVPLPANQHQYPTRRESGSFLFKQLSLTSPNFAPFNPLSYSPSSAAAGAAARPRSSTLSFPSYGEESEVRETSSSSDSATPHPPPPSSTATASGTIISATRKTPGLSDMDTEVHSGVAAGADPSDASAAALLLNFSTSPEVLRPIGSTSSSSQRSSNSVASSSPSVRPTIGLGSRTSRSTFTSPQYRPVSVNHHHHLSSSNNSAFRIPNSAPGGSRAVMVNNEKEGPNEDIIEDLDLDSPPHLVLDASPEEDNNSKAQDQDEMDKVSDSTVDDTPDIKTVSETAKDLATARAMEVDS